ncbi:AMP-binding protein [Allobranchiibius sp. GilTou73]|uniref:AMP-binding protein n=1 Tax=Allobranchiibius sp. GilTou73 TaxID=2904523 RepID=UPI001F3706DD|nr:AMP-binding protein [Allobranchiibius sp. GilTou73]UIJ34632.1 AMP-binding protein [Allobranchiibius sp. GilTou73]
MSERLPAGADNRVVSRGYVGRWRDIDEAPDLPDAAAFLVADNTEAIRAVWQHVLHAERRETLVAARSRIGAEQEQGFRESGLAVVRPPDVQPALLDRPADPGRIWLLTSGSTGRPKQVAHTLDSLTTVGTDQPPRTWLCPYATGAYAWWQVVTLSIQVPGQDVVFVEPDEIDAWPALAEQHGVTAASGTPTFWRQAIFRAVDTLSRVPLRQVTLGGEPVDQAILDQLHEVYPDARISWIYASSEAGAAIAVHDGQAGFPAAWLDRETPGRPRLSVQDGELIIASAKAAEGMDAQIHTGDRAEIVGDRVLITGRIASDEINVGGSKASASGVRAVLLAHPAVAWAAVKGRRAPLVGNVVTAQVVLSGSGDIVTEAQLLQWCSARLPDYSVPRRLRVLPEIPIKESLKSDV